MHDFYRRHVCSFCLVIGSSLLTAQAKPAIAKASKKNNVSAPAKANTQKPGTAEPPAKTIYDFSLPASTGSAIPLSTYRGQTLLIVNLARQSSYNDQLAALAKLQTDFAGKKFTVVGVPSNDFGAGEPGADAAVAKFYADQKLGFPVMARSSLRGVEELPLFSFLATGKDMPAGGEVHWNYTKFLVDSRGKVVARFDPDVTPDSPELRATLQQVLDGTFATPKKDPAAQESGETDEDAQ